MFRWIRKTVARSNRNKLTNHVLHYFVGVFRKMANKKVPMGKIFTNSSVPIYNKLILVYFTITASNGEEFIYTVYKIISTDCLVKIIYLPWFCKHATPHDITLKSTCDVNLLSKLSIIFKEWRIMNNVDRGGVIVLFVL